MRARRLKSVVCLGVVAALAFPALAQKKFATAEQATDALITAAGDFDVAALKEILGPDGVDLVVTGDTVQDKIQAQNFAAKAREKHALVKDAKKPGKVMLTVGADDWPLPVPLVKEGTGWRYDTKTGRQEILYRRIGQNELDAIEVCRGYVEAQEDYATEKRDGAAINQYAQRVISTPGKHDGLAWQNEDGSWGGPVGEEVARVIAEGYSDKAQPYHGYVFKILKAQGPHASFGAIDFVVKGVMIGGFGLVASPTDYRVTGVKTFIVNQDGVVYEKDLGPETKQAFREMWRFDPDKTWHPVPDED